MKLLNKIKYISIISLSFCQVALSQGSIKNSFGSYFDALEVTPVFNGEKALITVPMGVAVGTETEIEGNYFFISEARYFKVYEEDVGGEEGLYLDNLHVRRDNLDSFSVMGGMRYYTNPYENSWYGDIKAGFQRDTGDYQGTNLDVTETSHSIPFVMELGHRFVLDQSYTIRLGARMSDRYILSQQLRNKSGEETQKVSRIAFEIPSALNVSIGYHF